MNLMAMVLTPIYWARSLIYLTKNRHLFMVFVYAYATKLNKCMEIPRHLYSFLNNFQNGLILHDINFL